VDTARVSEIARRSCYRTKLFHGLPASFLKHGKLKYAFCSSPALD